MTTVLKMARAIAADRRFGWNYLVENCIVCRSLEGNCLRGMLVDRTSTPGRYKLWAFTQPWFRLDETVSLDLAVEFTRDRFGDHTQVAEQLAPFLESDDELRRVIFAAPSTPIEVSPKAWRKLSDRLPDTFWFDSLLIRAWDGPHDALLPELQEFRANFDRNRPHEPEWDRYRHAAAELAACLAAGNDPRTVIERWNQAARTKLRIAPVARMRFGPAA